MAKLKTHAERFIPARPRSFCCRFHLWKIVPTVLLLFAALRLPARGKDTIQYGMGLIVNVPFSVSEVTQVVQDVAQNGIIRGTKEYNKDPYIEGAAAVSSTRVFPEKTEGTQVFYKVRLKALDPRNFKDSGDVGTLAVRYIVQPQGDKNTVLRIDARFVEDFRHVSHASDGSVESAEYKDIHDRLDAIEAMKSQTAEAEKEKQEYLAKNQPAQTPITTSESSSESSSSASQPMRDPAGTPPSTASIQTTVETLAQRVQSLRRQVERTVKAPGAPLKSAPFHTASTLQTLPAGTEVLIEVSTTYWFGVETHEGQHGWMLREQLEQLP